MRQRLFAAVACMLIATTLGPSQTNSGSIVGSVADSTGAIVPSAGVTVTNLGTGGTFKTSTDLSGNYVVTPLQVGLYSVTVEVRGFRKEVKSGIGVDVQSRVRVDFALQVGDVAESIEVVSAAPLLQTGTSDLGEVVDSQRVNDLPLNGRFFTRLAVLTAGAAPTTFSAADSKTGGFTANGVRPYENNYILDGIDNNTLQSGLTGGSSYVIGPPPDAIGEFKIQTNSMNAEFGRSAGGVMNVALKSGTNELHGSFYEYLRNSALDAKNFFDSPTGPIPPYKQNQFGASGGGPVYIPRVYDGKDKTFFFADFQGTRIRQGKTFLTSVPPASWRSGDFSGFQAIYDPASTTIVNGAATRQPFPGNQIPGARFDPVAKSLINQFPAPNLPGSVSSSGVGANFLSNPALKDDTNQFDVRIDHRFSNRDAFFSRFSFLNEDFLFPSEIPPPLGDANFQAGDTLNHARSAALSYTHIFTPRTINEFRAGYIRHNAQILQFDPNTNVVGQLGIPGIPYSAGNGGLPAFYVDGISSFGGAQYQPTVEIQNVYQLIDNLSLVRGAHTIKIGADIKPRVNYSFLQPSAPRGDFTFSGDFTRNPNNIGSTGLGSADFLLGALSGSEISTTVNDVFQQPAYVLFAQDDIKVSRKLTVNLGLRYEFVYHAREKYNAMANFNLATRALDIVKGRNDPLPANFDYADIPVNRNATREFVPNDKLNFAPRVGFAYNIFPKTVVRGGYGIFYSSFEAGPLSNPNMGLNPPFYLDATFPELSIVAANPRVSRLSQGFPTDALSQPDTPSFFALDPNFRHPYIQDWNFSVQRELGRNTVLDIAYAGSKGTALYEFRNANQAAPTADPTIPRNSRRPLPYLGTGLQLWCSCGSSTYHSLQAKLEKRFSNGVSFLTAYTFGKAIDERSQASFNLGSGDGFRDAARHPEWEKGLADYDVRHRFVASYSYELPVGRGKKFGANMNRAADLVFGGWELVGIDSFQTGLPITLTAGTGVANSDGQNRPDIVPGVSLIPSSQGPSQWFNPAALRSAVPGTFGNAGRNILEGPGQINIDFSVFKNFRLGERRTLQFRSEFFNLPNHPNFQGNGIQRRFDRSGPGQLTAANPSRQIQLALRLTY